jgi:hypothetical protein
MKTVLDTPTLTTPTGKNYSSMVDMANLLEKRQLPISDNPEQQQEQNDKKR